MAVPGLGVGGGGQRNVKAKSIEWIIRSVPHQSIRKKVRGEGKIKKKKREFSVEVPVGSDQ